MDSYMNLNHERSDMALPVGQDNSLDSPETYSLPVPPPRPTQMVINPVEREKRMHKPLGKRAEELVDATRREAEKLYDEARTRTSEWVDTTRREAERLYGQARDRASDGYERLSDTAHDAGDQTRAVARYLRNDYPLQTVAVLAGAAFLTGMLLRVWRANA